MARRSKKQWWSRFLYFVQPQPANRYRSKLLHPQSVAILSLVVLALFALINAIRFFPALADRVLGFSSNIDVTSLLTQTNQQRAELGLEPLVLNEELNQAALAKAQDMFNDQYWAHVAPDGKQAWDFIKAANYNYRHAGENLARDFDSSAQVVAAWMASPSHRENMVNPDFSHMGLAVVNGNLRGFNTTLVVQLFAIPNAAPLRGEVGSQKTIPMPKAAEPQFTSGGVVAGEQRVSNDIVLSPLNVTRAIFLMVVVMIVLTLSYDSLVARNRKYSRLVGENVAHISVFITVAFLLILFKGGAVLP